MALIHSVSLRNTTGYTDKFRCEATTYYIYVEYVNSYNMCYIWILHDGTDACMATHASTRKFYKSFKTLPFLCYKVINAWLRY